MIRDLILNYLVIVCVLFDLNVFCGLFYHLFCVLVCMRSCCWCLCLPFACLLDYLIIVCVLCLFCVCFCLVDVVCCCLFYHVFNVYVCVCFFLFCVFLLVLLRLPVVVFVRGVLSYVWFARDEFCCVYFVVVC